MCDRHGRFGTTVSGSISSFSTGWVGQSGVFARVHEFKEDAQYTYRNSLVTTAFELTLLGSNGANHSTPWGIRA